MIASILNTTETDLENMLLTSMLYRSDDEMGGSHGAFPVILPDRSEAVER